MYGLLSEYPLLVDFLHLHNMHYRSNSDLGGSPNE